MLNFATCRVVSAAAAPTGTAGAHHWYSEQDLAMFRHLIIRSSNQTTKPNWTNTSIRDDFSTCVGVYFARRHNKRICQCSLTPSPPLSLCPSPSSSLLLLLPALQFLNFAIVKRAAWPQAQFLANFSAEFPNDLCAACFSWLPRASYTPSPL